MAKESMKAREVKRAKLVAALPVVPKDISANLAFLVSNSVKWHRQDLSPA